MGSIVNILPVLYDENESHKFKPLKDFNKKEWLTGNNYWFKTLEDSSVIIVLQNSCQPDISYASFLHIQLFTSKTRRGGIEP